MRARIAVTILLVFFFAIREHAQVWSGLIPAGSGIDWTQAGMSFIGGIPTTRVRCGNILTPSGGSDVAQIQAALDRCAHHHPLTANSPGDGGYVQLGSGTFQITAPITMRSNVTLRGNGPRLTILNNTVTARTVAVFAFGNTGLGLGTAAPSTTYDTITSGATQGSTSITVTGSLTIKNPTPTAGQLLFINGTDPSYVNVGDCANWCPFDGRSTGQTVEVLSSNSGTVTFRPPLYSNYSSPHAYLLSWTIKYAGLEYVQVYSNNSTNACNGNNYTCGVEVFGAALYSWVKGVEHNFADEGHTQVGYSIGLEIRDNFFHDGFYHGAGQNDNHVNFNHGASAGLVENNILDRMHTSIMTEFPGGGHVFAYNYITGNYHTNFPGVKWMIMDTDAHGANPWYVLWEGNIADKFEQDDIHGTSSYYTLFRNYYSGSRLFVPPNDARGALTYNGPGTCTPCANASTCPSQAYTMECWESENPGSVAAYKIDETAWYDNIVGDIAGSAHLAASGPAGIITYPNPTNSNNACVSIGYYGNGSGGTSIGAAATTYLHGVYNCANGTFQWANGVSHALPASFYLPPGTKPNYWGSVPWPPIGPDVTSGNLWSGHANAIPAMNCFNNSPKDANGYPLFDPATCYRTSATPPIGIAPSPASFGSSNVGFRRVPWR